LQPAQLRAHRGLALYSDNSHTYPEYQFSPSSGELENSKKRHDRNVENHPFLPAQKGGGRVQIV
jgi:hypothetical protein